MGIRRMNGGRWPIRMIGLIGLLMTIGPASGQEASKGARPAPLARYFPRRDLVAYAEFDGLDSHRAAWEKTAAYRLLTETTTGAMLEQSAARLLDLILTPGNGQRTLPVGGRDLVALGEHLMRSGCVLGINSPKAPGPPRCAAVVIRGAAAGRPGGHRSAPGSRPESARHGEDGREARWRKVMSWAIRRGAARPGGPRGTTWS